MEIRRVFLAMSISLLILLGWQEFFMPKVAPPAKGEPQAAVAQAGNGSSVSQPQAAATGAPQAVPAAKIEDSVIENDVVRLTLTSGGAMIKTAELKHYTDAPGAAGKTLVLQKSPKDYAALTELKSGVVGKDAVYSIADKKPGAITYSFTAANGLVVEKTFSLEPGRYDVNVTAKVLNATATPYRDQLLMSVATDYDKNEGSSSVFHGPVFMAEESVTEVSISNAVDDAETKNKAKSGKVVWAGNVEKYFMTMMIPPEKDSFDMAISGEKGSTSVVKVTMLGPSFDLNPGAAVDQAAKVYIGPKDRKIVGVVGYNLEDAIDSGWLKHVSRPLMNFLNVLYDYVGNYGIAILILTTIIKIIFWPLSQKSLKSMARMKELSPKVQVLKEKYSKDPERLNREMMHLWKTHKVNPLSGCLPIMVQIPVFIALYRTLMYSIEIRHAPFFFWITDLAAKDPYYITPLLMGASMFVQQKLTPSTGMQEAQMKIMMYGMPVLFTWLFMDFPSGLVIYWLWNNVISVGQQAMTLRKAKSAAS